MLVFATSDKGGTGRSVTSSNLVYRQALQGGDACYLDFDFGSPTAGAIFNIPAALHGTNTGGGLHAYLTGTAAEPQRIDVWSESDRGGLRGRPAGAGQLLLLPGDRGGGEFPSSPEMVQRCASLLLRLDEEFDVCLIDLSAGRSYAIEMALAATADPALSQVTSRWLVFHRWTRQHIIAAGGLVYGPRGMIEAGVALGHDRDRLTDSIRFVRTAVVDPNSAELSGLRMPQLAWLRDINVRLQELASREGVGRMLTLGSVPLDPVLQWREQIITDVDAHVTKVANRQTVDAFTQLADRILDPASWTGL